MLTTFNCTMTAVIETRAKKDVFEKKHGNKLSASASFFVKACIAALKRSRASSRDRRARHRLQESLCIGVAVGTEMGLVVPVVRDADATAASRVRDQ
ncbi:MAG: 2-oxo acid dehydrogenase subunit E2 [Alphaproteobacteria bacterium]